MLSDAFYTEQRTFPEIQITEMPFSVENKYTLQWQQ